MRDTGIRYSWDARTGEHSVSYESKSGRVSFPHVHGGPPRALFADSRALCWVPADDFCAGAYPHLVPITVAEREGTHTGEGEVVLARLCNEGPPAFFVKVLPMPMERDVYVLTRREVEGAAVYWDVVDSTQQ